MIKKIFVLATCLASLMSSFAIAQTPTKVKAIVFDFGGVIATTDRAKIIQFLTETFQLSEQELKPALGRWKKVLVNGENEKEFWTNYAASVGVVLPEVWFDEYDKVTGFTDIPGMIAIVKNLQDQGFQTPMLSNIQQYQANVVRRFDYYGLFDPVLLSYEIGYEKPQKEAYAVLLDKLQLSPSEVVFIDDQIDNVNAAKSIGIDAIHFISPCRLVEDLGKRNIHLPKEITMSNYTVVEKPEIFLVGIDCRTSNDAGAAMNDIPALWERFYSENIIGQIPDKVSEEVIALYCDYEGDHTKPYSVVIGCPVTVLDGVPEGLVAKQIPGGTYAAYRAIGEHPQTLIETWGQIWRTDLPRTYTGDYEVYGEKFTSNSPQEVEVFIAIENR